VGYRDAEARGRLLMRLHVSHPAAWAELSGGGFSVCGVLLRANINVGAGRSIFLLFIFLSVFLAPKLPRKRKVLDSGLSSLKNQNPIFTLPAAAEILPRFG
jgi:hypothetical protein